MTNKLCSICQKPNTLFPAILSCGHKAHKKCFSQTTTGKVCFVCNTKFLTKIDKKILDSKTPEKAEKTIRKTKHFNASTIYLKTKNPTIKRMMIETGDHLEYALKEEIESNNQEGVKLLLESGTINFHATFNNKTLLEIAIAMGVEEIINAIKVRMGLKTN